MGEHLVDVLTRPKIKSTWVQHHGELTSIGVNYSASYKESPNLRSFIDNLRGADYLILEGPESRMKFLTIETLVQSYEALAYNLHQNDDPSSKFWVDLGKRRFKPEDFASFRKSKIHYLTDGFDFIKLGEKYGFSKELFTTYYMLCIFNSINIMEEKAKPEENDPVNVIPIINNFSERNTFKTMVALTLNYIPGWNGNPTVDEIAGRLNELLCEEEKAIILPNQKEEVEKKNQKVEEILRENFTKHFFQDIRNYEIVGPRMRELVSSLEGKKVAVLGLANLEYSIRCLPFIGEQKEKPKQWEQVIQNLSEKEQELIYSIENRLFPLEKRLKGLSLGKMSKLKFD